MFGAKKLRGTTLCQKRANSWGISAKIFYTLPGRGEESSLRERWLAVVIWIKSMPPRASAAKSVVTSKPEIRCKPPDSTRGIQKEFAESRNKNARGGEAAWNKFLF
jgi:hypothetical protein